MHYLSNHSSPYGYELTSQTGQRYLFASRQLEPIHQCMTFMRILVEGAQRNRRIAQREAHLAKHYRHLHLYSTLFSQRYTLHPYLRHYLEVYREHPIALLRALPWNARTHGGETVKEVFVDFLAHAQAKAKISNLRKSAVDWQDKFTGRATRLIAIGRKLCVQSVRATVIELELAYQASVISDEEVSLIMAAEDQRRQADSDAYWNGDCSDLWGLEQTELLNVRVPWAQVHADRKRFFANLKGRPTLFKDLWGYVWRAQFTPVVGYSLRVSLIFDAAASCSAMGQPWLASSESSPAAKEWAAEKAQEIGAYWCEVITQGRGLFCAQKPWPALQVAQEIATLGSNHSAQRKQLWGQLMGHLGSPMLAVQAIPHAGCNQFGTSMDRCQLHPQAAKPALRGDETRRGSRIRAIQNLHSNGGSGTYAFSAPQHPSVVDGQRGSDVGGVALSLGRKVMAS